MSGFVKESTRPFKKVASEVKRSVKIGYELQKDLYSKRSIAPAAAAATFIVTGSPTAAAVAYQAGSQYTQREALKDIKSPLPTALSPIPKTVMARERAEREKLGKKRRRATVMGGGLGELTLGKPGLLGV